MFSTNQIFLTNSNVVLLCRRMLKLPLRLSASRFAENYAKQKAIESFWSDYNFRLLVDLSLKLDEKKVSIFI